MTDQSTSPPVAIEPKLSVLLTQSERLIRSQSRSPRYWQGGDRLAEAWLGRSLGVPAPWTRANVNLAAVCDTLYEEYVEHGQIVSLRQLTLDLQDQAVPSRADDWIARAEKAPPVDLRVAAKWLVAALTFGGYDALSRKSTTQVAQRWLELWQQALWKHNSQQERGSALEAIKRLPAERRTEAMALAGISPGDVSLGVTSFEEGVREYLENYGEAGAGALSLLGAIPFAPTLTSSQFGELLMLVSRPKFLEEIARLLRLAQDLSFNPAEFLNAGLAGYAAERREPILGPSEAHAVNPREASLRLRQLWADYFPKAKARIERLAADAASLSVGPVVHSLLSCTGEVLTAIAARTPE